MRIGYSITSSEVIAAETAEYGDCAKFQIVCPSCREAVFKGLRHSKDESETHYFSHYHASSEDARLCEQRVAAILKQQQAKTFADGHGQTLAEFMQVFREKTVRVMSDLGVMPYEKLWRQTRQIMMRKDIDKLCEPLLVLMGQARKSLRIAAPTLVRARDDLAKSLSQMPPFADQSPFWCRRKASYGLDVLTYLATPQGQPNLRFAAAAVHSIVNHAPDHFGHVERDRTRKITRRWCRAVCEGQPPETLRKLIDDPEIMGDLPKKPRVSLRYNPIPMARIFRDTLMAGGSGHLQTDILKELTIGRIEAREEFRMSAGGISNDLATVYLAADFWSTFMALVSVTPELTAPSNERLPGVRGSG